MPRHSPNPGRARRAGGPGRRRLGAARLALAAALAVGLTGGCRSTPKSRPPQIVLVLVDTLRADHLSSYGYERPTTPFIDELAAGGALFEAAIAQASWTAPSMASLWTSRMPSEVGVRALQEQDGMRHIRDRFVSGMREDATTLAEVLRDAGYHTIAATSNSFTTDKFFMLQGFEQSRFTGGLADHLFASALELIDERTDRSKPVFVYVHLADVHHPITPPSPYDRMFATIDGKPHDKRHINWAFSDGRSLLSDAFKIYRSHKLALYDGALRFVDDELRKFRAQLRQRGFGDDTIVVVASDHGEDFWENAKFQCDQHLDPRDSCGIGHGHSMSHPVLHVPLVMAGPGIPVGRVARQVRNLDIAPTLLNLAGIRPPKEMRGIDLFASTAPRLAISEDIAYGYNARAIQDGNFKLVIYDRTKTGNTDFVFHKIPRTSREVLIDNAAVEARLKGALGGNTGRQRDGRKVEVDEETRRRLRALGYVD